MKDNNTKPNLTFLRWVALFEGTSLLLLLFVAMPLKYYADLPIAVRIIGPVHGVLFLGFIGLLLLTYLKQHIRIVQLLTGIAAALIPFGSFVFKAKMLK